MSVRGTGLLRKLLDLPSLFVPPSRGRLGTRPWTSCGPPPARPRALPRPAGFLRYSNIRRGWKSFGETFRGRNTWLCRRLIWNVASRSQKCVWSRWLRSRLTSL